MNATLNPTPFELAGRFGGFVFTEAGKRRMLLRGAGADWLLKVPKELRRRIVGKFGPGETIRVAGVEEPDPVTGGANRIVSRVLPDAATASPGPMAAPVPTLPVGPPAASVPIRVCSKKHCWRNGGRELCTALGREIEARGLAEQIEVRQVGCLGRCKHAPNADRGRHEYTRCDPAAAAAMVLRAAADLPSQGTNR